LAAAQATVAVVAASSAAGQCELLIVLVGRSAVVVEDPFVGAHEQVFGRLRHVMMMIHSSAAENA